MKRIGAALLALSLIGSFLASARSSPPAAAASPPNIVLVLVDDLERLRAEHVIGTTPRA